MDGRKGSEESEQARSYSAANVPVPLALMRMACATFAAVLAVITLMSATVGLWAHRTLLDTETYVATVAPLARDAQVIEAIASRLTTEVVDLLEIERRIGEALPREYSLLAIPITEAVRNQVRQVLIRAMETDQFARVWESANRLAHKTVVAILRNDLQYTDTSGGEVKVDLVLLGADVIRELGKRISLVGSKLPVPEIDSSASPAEVREILGAGIGRTIPEEFGQVTLFRSEQLAAAQRGVTTLDRVVPTLVILVIFLCAGAVLLSIRRLRMVIVLGVSVVLASAVVQAGIRELGSSAADSIVNPQLRIATSAGVAAFTGSLDSYFDVLVIGGIFAIAIAFLASRNAVVVLIRDRVGIAFGKAVERGSRLPLSASSRQMEWVVRNRRRLQVAGLVVVVAAILIWNPSVKVVLLLLLILTSYEFVLSLTEISGEVDEKNLSTGETSRVSKRE